MNISKILLKNLQCNQSGHEPGANPGKRRGRGGWGIFLTYVQANLGTTCAPSGSAPANCVRARGCELRSRGGGGGRCNIMRLRMR